MDFKSKYNFNSLKCNKEKFLYILYLKFTIPFKMIYQLSNVKNILIKKELERLMKLMFTILEKFKIHIKFSHLLLNN
ncbi:hypothetical protein BpHYR1_010317 [Brachionus plicatilis]|uniref:Uncharacterized protein n=1 Tax=Brachionus plicatilis TaxID=10195 RepID=A0A3M7PZD5_BRAPC|nr:hypothetical protein BpHYR1_010317 [Brachionus plicatilis]